jgi:diguanylate cyclase (GGDEF)-like protein
MAPQPSQRSLGLLRQILEAMEPPELITLFEKKKFWKDRLFDFGFSPTVIDIARSYDFKWSNIIPDLFTGNFRDHYSRVPSDLSHHLCRETLGTLLALAIDQNRGKSLTKELQRSLRSDGFGLGLEADVDSTVPAELARLPGRDALSSDLDRRLEAGELVAALFMDLDGFKAVNDTLGHAQGDDCLIQVARAMAAAILHKGKLYHRSGDEFVAVLPNFNGNEAVVTAERIRTAIDGGNLGGSLKVTVSIGVASSEDSGVTDAKRLLELADQAMYHAKKTKNRVVRSDSTSAAKQI